MFRNAPKAILIGATTLSLSLASALAALPAEAAPKTLNFTVDCAHPISVTADVGDTLIFTMVHPGCDGDAPSDAHPEGNYANLDNVNGTYFTGIGTHYQGTARGSGFLNYVSHAPDTYSANDYWYRHAGQDDWGVLQTASEADGPVVITTTLRAKDGNGIALRRGSVLADIFTQQSMDTSAEYLVTYAGPRTVPTKPALAQTGLDVSSEFFGALALGSLGVAISFFARKVRR